MSAEPEEPLARAPGVHNVSAMTWLNLALSLRPLPKLYHSALTTSYKHEH